MTQPAIVADDGVFSYADLDAAATRVAAALLDGRDDLDEGRVAFLVPPSFAYAAVQRGIWRAGGIAVPLAMSHPPAELDYVIRDAGADIVVADPALADRVAPLASAAGARFQTTAECLGAGGSGPLPSVAASRRAMIIYTSGTTGRPKGVVTTHANISVQIASLVEAWGWASRDRFLLALPLHHVHGIINGLATTLAVGGTCEMLPAFDAERVWDRLASGEITVFTAVPTVYYRLIDAWDRAPAAVQRERSKGARTLRLMMSGSSALPLHVLERWREITGYTLLERYGMTEIGMILSNPLEGERRPGSVGLPLPNVDVRIVDANGLDVPSGTPGEIEVRGPGVFLEYWRRPQESRDAFRDGWFRTGDVGLVEDGRYRLLGRASVDIIKTGGYKVSALEIEDVLRGHPAISDCAVVGIPDPEWGERVSVAVEPVAGSTLAIEELRQWSGQILAPYKVPTALRIIDRLPRNAMGKVTKSDVKTLF
jgi:malonyl-CoA/methylmalonyl-CoA synthetase